jgi:hypothetical protein
MTEGARCSLGPRIDTEACRATLHEDDWVMTVLAGDGGRQTQDKLCLGAACHWLEANGRKVMAFIDNELPVFCDQIIHNAPVSEALNHGDINDAGRLAYASANLANAVLRQTEKILQARGPLLHKLTAMHQDERADLACCK